ncbi:MAG TPA: pirin family protein [Planctomycetota bacterium]|nr:pirin family protein [Planctomycetota bacterium]
MTEKAKKRKIAKVWKSEPTIEGAGVHLRRAFGFGTTNEFDPFLLLDHMQSGEPKDYVKGFPWHPHRGMETITYVLDGEVEHGDSMGNEGLIKSGDVQWMTAGSGIVHQEMPQGSKKGDFWGFQLWANLPRKDKMMDPRYQEVKAKTIPSVKTEDGATVRVISGEVAGTRGPVTGIVTDPEYLDVSVPAGKTFTHAVKPDHTVFAYVIEGEGYFDDGRDAFGRDETPGSAYEVDRSCACGTHSLILFGPGRSIEVTTDKKPVRFLLVSGKPIKEPVAWYGPIVMNTQDELRTAFEEFQRGTFVKKGDARRRK